jgi:cell division septum initiation protein DivIVA
VNDPKIPSSDMDAPSTTRQPGNGARRDLVATSDLLKPTLPGRLFGGYRRPEVEDLLERAAATIAERDRTIESASRELEQSRHAEPSTEEVVMLMLQTASRVVEETKEDARHEAEELVAQARAEAEEIARLHGQAQVALDGALARAEAMLSGARAEAEDVLRAARGEAEEIMASARAEAVALTSAARSERDRLIANSTVEAEKAREALEIERSKIDEAIVGMRDTWSEQLRDALARIDAIDPGAALNPVAPEPSEPRHWHVDPLDLADELRDRVGTSETQSPLAPLEATEPDDGSPHSDD